MTEARSAKGVQRVYANDAIEVEWEPRLCIHTRASEMGGNWTEICAYGTAVRTRKAS
jgi:uncharacterized protein YbjQ (UPF0145 family)